MLSLPLHGHVSQMLALQVNQECFQGSPRPDQCGAAGAALPAAHLCTGEGAALLPAHYGPGVPVAAGSSAVPSRYPQCCCTPHSLGSVSGTAPASSKTALHPHPPAGLPPPAGPALGTELLSLLPGFLLVLSADSKLVYISENVAQVLGLSVVRPAHRAFAVTVPVPTLVPLLHALHAAPADAGLWLQQPVHPPCQPGPTETGTVSEGSPLFVRWSCSPRGTRSLTSWRGEWERMCTRNSSLPGRNLAGVREALAGLVDLATLLWPLAVNREPGPALLGAE